MNKFKNVAHFYHGCEVEIYVDTYKPILRPLSSMDAIERSKYNAVKNSRGKMGVSFYAGDDGGLSATVQFELMAQIINQLRRDGFDCDGLIESGEAIEAQATPPPPPNDIV